MRKTTLQEAALRKGVAQAMLQFLRRRCPMKRTLDKMQSVGNVAELIALLHHRRIVCQRVVKRVFYLIVRTRKRSVQVCLLNHKGSGHTGPHASPVESYRFSP